MNEDIKKRLKEFEESKERVKELLVEDVNNIWIEYDKQTDTLYIYFGKEEAEESIMLENDLIILTKDRKLLGIIVNDFSSRYLG